MKQFILLVLMLVVVSFTLAQNTSQLNWQSTNTAERARLFKTYNNYTATSDDTTGFVTINIPGVSSDPLLLPNVYLIAYCTDSINADVYVIGRNGTVTGTLNKTSDTLNTAISPYVDSLVTRSNTGSIAVITLRGPGINRLPGCTQFKVGTVFRGTAQGTTSGRYLKWYIMYSTQ